jgi:uncharacterized protein YndB with AHSA1/START domain
MTKMNLSAEPGQPVITITCVLNAPQVLVFKAYTDPRLISQWWGPRYLTTEIDQMEVKPGGRWRFVQHDNSANEYAFHGVYHEITAPKRLVFTFEYEGMPGHVLLETVTLADEGGKTLVTDQSVFQSVADRDGMLNTGMEEGSGDSMARLAELLVEMV